MDALGGGTLETLVGVPVYTSDLSHMANETELRGYFDNGRMTDPPGFLDQLWYSVMEARLGSNDAPALDMHSRRALRKKLTLLMGVVLRPVSKLSHGRL